MNEKELNMENSVNGQTDGILDQQVNLMEDFTQAVTPENVEAPVKTISVEDPKQEMIQTLEPVPSEEAISPVEQNVGQPEVEETVLAQNSSVVSNHEFEAIDSESEAPSEVGQVNFNQTEITQPKKNNWVFIILLFAIVGAFVIALPFLVKTFGY